MFDLRSGQNVGGYTLIERLGGGAMGSVWRVKDDGGHFYAMKILRASMLENEDDNLESAEVSNPQEQARLRLRREALALQKIHHEGVCSIVDMELDASIAFIVTELIDGHNLKEDVAINGPYAGGDLERLAHKLIDAVKAVHSAGIIHRDIKPTNIIISTTGPILVDFGISMGQGESHVTRTGLVMGTPGFIAPEIIEGGESSELTDWWSVAAVLAFAATGKPVFGTKPIMAVLERAASGNANLNGLPIRTMQAFKSALNPKRSERCTPEQLENAIFQDAMNPTDWQDSSYPFEHSFSGETVPNNAKTHDFNTTFQTRTLPENPRKMWVSKNVDNTTLLHSTESDLIDPEPTSLLDATSTSTTKVYANGLEQAIDPEQVTEPEQIANSEQATKIAEPPELDENPHPNVNKYLFRGRVAAAIFLTLASLLAAISPIDALAANLIFMLITATIGYNVCSSVRRKRANESVGGKYVFIRIASIPWHFIKAIAYSIKKVITLAIAGVIGAYVYPILIHASSQLIKVQVWSISVILPTYAPDICSPTSIGYIIGFIAGWIISFILGKTKIFAVGAGAICGAGKSQATDGD